MTRRPLWKPMWASPSGQALTSRSSPRTSCSSVQTHEMCLPSLGWHEPHTAKSCRICGRLRAIMPWPCPWQRVCCIERPEFCFHPRSARCSCRHRRLSWLSTPSCLDGASDRPRLHAVAMQTPAGKMYDEERHDTRTHDCKENPQAKRETSGGESFLCLFGSAVARPAPRFVNTERRGDEQHHNNKSVVAPMVNATFTTTQ